MKQRRLFTNRLVSTLAVLCLVVPAAAQQSVSYKLDESVFNAGGHPSGGAVLTSSSYRISLDAIGEALLGPGLAGASFRLDAGFGAGYPPPGEVTGLQFTNAVTLTWTPERSVGAYNLYRGTLGSFPGGGSCLQQEIGGETAADNDPVPMGSGFFYLVTAENRLGEEGSNGTASAGTPRPGGTCP